LKGPVAPPTDVKVSVINSTTVMVTFKSPRQQLWNGKLTRIVVSPFNHSLVHTFKIITFSFWMISKQN